MAKTLIWAVALIVSALILASGGIGAQLMTPINEDDDDGAGMTPKQVEVVNFPATQRVNGRVAVRNFPPVQEVVGTVDVGNLPLDSEGNVRVSAAGTETPTSGPIHFVGLTDAHEKDGPLRENRICAATFANTRLCTYIEVMRSIPPPPEFPSLLPVIVSHEKTVTGIFPIEIVDTCVTDDGFVGECASGVPAPAACCGF